MSGLIIQKLGETYKVFLDSEYKYRYMVITDNGDGTFDVIYFNGRKVSGIYQDYYDNFGVSDIRELIERLKKSPKFYETLTGEKVEYGYVAEEEIYG